MRVRSYDFEGTVYVGEDILEEIAKDFFEEYGKDKEWDDLNDYIWDYYSGTDNWDQVLDEITSDVFEIYEKLAGKENEEE